MHKIWQVKKQTVSYARLISTRYIAMSFFFLLAKYYACWCRHVKVTANGKEDVFERQYTFTMHFSYRQFYQ